MSSSWQLKIVLTLLVGFPAVVLRLSGTEPTPVVALLLFGAAIVSAAMVLAWTAEAAQVDISAGLAIALLALIAVLPEYAVDLYFAYTSGSQPEFAQYAAANMTGSNRLLLGLGWPVVLLMFILGARRRGQRTTEGRPITSITLNDDRRVEMGFLAAASIYAFVIPAVGRLSVLDGVVLIALFIFYIRTVARAEHHEPELIGVAASIAEQPRIRRRAIVAGLFTTAAVYILVSAEPFAHALVESGKELGIDEFLLVQWLAPLASESPEFIVAALLAYRGKGDAGFGTLLSSKVNQWTLLVGTIPFAHLVGGGGGWLELDARQVEEFILTAAQTVLGLAVLLNLRFGFWEGAGLFGLFVLQFVFPGVEARLIFSGIYLVVAAGILVWRRAYILPTVRAVVPRRAEKPAAERE